MKKITSLLLSLLLLLSLSVPALAASDVGVVSYQRRYFVFGPGSLHSPTDLFPALKGVMPGDKLTQDIKVVHNGSRGVNIRVYMRAVGSENFNKALIDHMDMYVEHRDSNILYDEGDANQDSKWIKLATLAPGKSTNLTVHLDVDPLMGNEFAEDWGTVVWEFKVEEIPIDTTNAKTSDDSHIALWATLLIVSAAAVVVLLIVKKRKNK